MIIYDCIQGTPEWAALRAGIPTASDFDKILTPSGKASKSAEPYMFALLAERMMGHPRVDYMSHWMDRGSQMEAEAVKFYELQRDCDTVKVGFITNDDGTVGASPDRLVGDSGLAEFKVPSEAVHVAYLMQAGSAYDAYKIQTQGQLWIAEREWNDLVSFHPEMPPALIRVERDELFIATMATMVAEFVNVLETNATLLKARGWITDYKPRSKTASKLMREVLLEVNQAK